ncbi:MAG: hypothetical protein MZV64_70650 [Ignavibacteriales bacterium]|nr:hypothetical protein [Ignavibacteriales bacterium]
MPGRASDARARAAASSSRASGGPFRTRPRTRSPAITPEEALRHPDLGHGQQDHHRLGHPDEQGAGGDRGPAGCSGCRRTGSDVIVHPQSVIHSMVEYVDGSVLAQLGVAGHAAADPVRPDVSGPLRVSRGAVVSGTGWRPDVRGRWTAGSSRASTWRTRRRGAEGRGPRS